MEVVDLPASALITARSRLESDLHRWGRPVWTRLIAVPATRWRQLVLVLLAAWILANLARLVWLLLPISTAPLALSAGPSNPVAAPRTPANVPAVDIETLIGWHLFGEAGAAKASVAGVIEAQAQNTSLNLQLVGLVQSSDEKLARAILLIDGQQQQFAIGEQLPTSGKVVLAKVLADRAIIENNGRYETLWLYDPDSMGKLGARSTQGLRANGAVNTAVAGYRDQFNQNPASLANLIQISVQQDGFRIRPGGDPKTFAALGLRTDDVVTAINGIAVNDPQKAVEIYQQMRTAREAALTIRRGGEDIVINVSLQGATAGDGQ